MYIPIYINAYFELLVSEMITTLSLSLSLQYWLKVILIVLAIGSWPVQVTGCG